MQQGKDLYLTQKAKKSVIRIQAIYRGKKQRKVYAALKKKHRYRKNVINELINTEQGYIRDLNIVIEKVLGPLPSRNILTEDKINEIFLNIEQISKVNQTYLDFLTVKGTFGPKDNYTPYKVVFDQSNTVIANFRVYFDYCNGYQKSSKTLEVMAQSPDWTKYMLEIRQSNVLKGMDLLSYLVKPVQRLPKYVLLYRDLLKHTDQDHPDYKNINFGLHEMQRLNEENNKNMDIFLNRLRLTDIESQLKLDNKLSSDPDRLFRFEETLSYIEGGKDEKNVIVYALSDMLLVIDRDDTTHLLKILNLDALSFVKDQKDSKYFHHLFSVVGQQESIQFQAENNATQQRLITQFDHLIAETREYQRKRDEQKTGQQVAAQYPIQVYVMGTEDRAYQSFQQHSVYITEISILKVSLKIFVRFSEIKELYDKLRDGKLKRQFPDLKIPQFPSDSWLQNHKTKVIEQRKLFIEQFLQAVLQHKKTRSCQEVMDALNLPPTFYDLPQIYNNYIEQQTHQKQQRLSMQPFKQQATIDPKDKLLQYGINLANLQKSAGEILNAYFMEQRSMKVPATLLIPSEICEVQHHKSNQMKVDVFLPDDTQIRISVSKDARVSEVVDFVSKTIKLRYYNDFRLYLKDQLQNYRLLDDDEVISKVLKDESKDEGLLKGMFNKIEKALASSSGFSLHLRKYLFLPLFQEEYDFKTDPVRTRIIAFQILDFVRTQKFYMQFNDYCLYAALYYCVKYTQMVESDVDKIPMDKISEVVPQQIYKSNNEKDWHHKTRELLKLIKAQLESISSQNKAAKLQGVNTEFPILTEFSDIACSIIFNSIKENRLASMGVYHVDTHPKTMEWMQKQQIPIYPNIYIGVSSLKLHFLQPARKEVFKSFEYSKITKVKQYPKQIIFEFLNYKEDQLTRFNTPQSYEINNLIEVYGNLQRFAKDYDITIIK